MLRVKKDLREVKKVIGKLRNFSIGVLQVVENKNTYDLVLVNARGEIMKDACASDLNIKFSIRNNRCILDNIFFQSKQSSKARSVLWSNKGLYTIVSGLKIVLN